MKLFKKTFTTKDASGCAFLCNAYYSRDFNVEQKKTITECTYVAEGLGCESTSLNQLKIMVSGK